MIVYCNHCKYKRIHMYGYATCKKNPDKEIRWDTLRISEDFCHRKNRDNDCPDFKPVFMYRWEYK